MKRTRFTPGPWCVTTNMDYWVEKCIKEDAEDDFNGIAHCGDIHWPDYAAHQDEWQANAHLIAAAPCMYAALKNIEEVLIPLFEVYADESARQILRGARAALSKARGEQS